MALMMTFTRKSLPLMGEKWMLVNKLIVLLFQDFGKTKSSSKVKAH